VSGMNELCCKGAIFWGHDVSRKSKAEVLRNRRGEHAVVQRHEDSGMIVCHKGAIHVCL
jgi:hypothetical protein